MTLDLLKNYIEQLHKKVKPWPLLVSAIYLGRLRRAGVQLTSRNIRQIFFVGTIIALKFHDDFSLSTRKYCSLFPEQYFILLAHLEGLLLGRLGYRVVVLGEELQSLELG